MARMEEKLIIKDYTHQTGHHCWTTSFKNAFAYHGINLSEEMAFGLQGGAGFIYWYMKMMLSPFIGTRTGKTDSLIRACERIGGSATLFETSSVKRGYDELKKILREGEPAFVFADMVYLPYLALPEEAHFGAHTIIVYGIDEEEDKVYVSDAAKKPFIITIEDLNTARNSKHAPYAPKNKLLKIKYPTKPKNLKGGIVDAIKECCNNYLDPPIRNIGHKGIMKWADLIMDWPNQFKGLYLMGCLMNTYIFIEESGSNGGGYRNTYAQFLKESSEIINKSELTDVAKLFEEAGDHWTKLALSGLPDSWSTLKEFRELAKEKNKIFEEQPLEALKKMQEITKESNKVMRAAADELDSAKKVDIDALMMGIKDNILLVYEKDKLAFTKLKEVVEG